MSSVFTIPCYKGINNLEAAKGKVIHSVKATSNAGKTGGANFDIFEVKTNINKAIVKVSYFIYNVPLLILI